MQRDSGAVAAKTKNPNAVESDGKRKTNGEGRNQAP